VDEEVDEILELPSLLVADEAELESELSAFFLSFL